MKRGVFVVACLLILGACSAAKDPTPAEQSALACDHFRNVAGDWDIMREEERAEKLREIYDDTYIATRQVRQASRDLLKHYLAGDDGRATTAIGRLDRACAATGH